VDISVKGEPLQLDIFLPPQFPLTAPEIKLSRRLQHPWVRDHSLSDCPSLRNFSVQSNLGEIVSEVIQELNENSVLIPNPSPLAPHVTPPTLPTSPQAMTSPHSQSVLPSFHQRPPVGSYQPYYQFSSQPQPLPQQPQPQPPAQKPRSPRSSPKPKRKAPPPPRVERRGYTPPPVPTEFPTVSEMSNEELEKFLDEKEGSVLVEEYVRNMDAVKKIQADRDLLFQENEDQAHINLGHEPELQNGWTRLQEESFELMAEKERYDRQSREQMEIRDKYLKLNKSVALRLKSLAREAETESEIMAEDFLENRTQKADDFIRTFKEKRKLHYLRISKSEKLERRH
jgi:hypothetical protein